MSMLIAAINGRYFRPCFSSPLPIKPRIREASKSITKMKKIEKYFMKLVDTLMVERVKGKDTLVSTSGRPEKIFDISSTRTVESENRAGAAKVTAIKINIKYIITFEAAFFSRSCL